MQHQHKKPRQRRSPPVIRHPRVPSGERLVRTHGWLTTDHPGAYWFRLTQHSPDWSQVQLEVKTHPESEPIAFEAVVLPNGFVVPKIAANQLGSEAIRIIATVIRAKER